MFGIETDIQSIVSFTIKLSIVLVIGAGMIGFTIKKLIQLLKG